ncbi:hypothetical protein BD310DRAFT_910950, partial [Dichomitus squalens]
LRCLHKFASDPDSILAFLNSLSPALPALLPVFMVMGVNDPVTLRGLSGMESRDRWLYSWVKEGRITESQFKIIRAGMQKIQQHSRLKSSDINFSALQLYGHVQCLDVRPAQNKIVFMLPMPQRTQGN